MHAVKHSFSPEVKHWLLYPPPPDCHNQAMLMRGREFGLYLKGLAAECGVSNTRLAEVANVSVQAVTGWFKTGRIGKESLAAIAPILGKSLDTLLRLVADDGQEAATPLDLDAQPDLTSVPRVRFKLAAGVSGYAVEPESGNGKPVFFRKDWFVLHGYRPNRLFAVRVNGSSMEPTLWDGDLVVINTDSVEPRDGVAFALNYEGELVIKRLRRNAGAWWAESDNSDQRRFGPKQCTEDVKILGEVVYKQSERI
jgi:phage repressor protein C with HTH and peptisase S24 domain